VKKRVFKLSGIIINW